MEELLIKTKSKFDGNLYVGSFNGKKMYFELDDKKDFVVAVLTLKEVRQLHTFLTEQLNKIDDERNS